MLNKMKRRILLGEQITKEDARYLLNVELQALARSANAIREHFCGNSFDLCSIINAKSGRCSENCKFCSQSIHYQTSVDEYDVLEEAKIHEQALYNEKKGVGRFSLVTAGKQVNAADFQNIRTIYMHLKKKRTISLCASMGLLTLAQLQALKKVGLTRYHNNLETSRKYFPSVCTTHSIEQKIQTIQNAKLAGLEVCSGGIMGMGESWHDRIDLAFELRALQVQSIPINILNPVQGTPFASLTPLPEEEIVRIFAIFRFIHPTATIRMGAGRNLLQDMGKRVFQSGANGSITGDMLTTKGISIEADQALLKELHYEVSKV